MAGNTNYTEALVASIEARSPIVQDNFTKNNALLSWLKKKGKVKTFSGGTKIIQPLSYAENGNVVSFSGAEELPIASSEVLTAPEFAIKQYACAVVQTGLEDLQNADGPSRQVDLLAAKMAVAEGTMANKLSEDLYSDGTSNGSKGITGLEALLSADPTTGTYGNINRATAGNEFWRHQLNDVTISTSNASGEMMELWAACKRGADEVDLILVGNQFWSDFTGQLQPLQRFESGDTAQVGFSSIKFNNAMVVLDGGIGGYADTDDAYFINSKYVHWRPHADCNMVPSKKKSSVNQDAEVVFLMFAGNLTCSGAKFCGRLKGD